MNSSILLFCIAITVGIYLVSRKAAVLYPSPFTTPVFFSTTFIIIVLLVMNISAEQYAPAKEIMTFLLGPATVALAVPLYRNRAMIIRYWKSAGIGLFFGTISTMATAVFILKMFQLSSDVVASVSVKSVTVPIALEITRELGGNQPLTTAFVVATGILGSMMGPWFMTKVGITNPLARGLSLGTLSHGQGTAQAAVEGELQGAVAGVAMGIAAVFTAFIAPVFVPFFL